MTWYRYGFMVTLLQLSASSSLSAMENSADKVILTDDLGKIVWIERAILNATLEKFRQVGVHNPRALVALRDKCQGKPYGYMHETTLIDKNLLSQNGTVSDTVKQIALSAITVLPGEVIVSTPLFYE